MTPAPALAPPTSGSLKVEEELSEAWPSVFLVFLTTTRAALRRGRFCDCLWSSLSESLMNRIKHFMFMFHYHDDIIASSPDIICRFWWELGHPPVPGDWMLDCPDPAVHGSVEREVHVRLGHVQKLLLVILLPATTSWRAKKDAYWISIRKLIYLYRTAPKSRQAQCRIESSTGQRTLRNQQGLVRWVWAPESGTPCPRSRRRWWRGRCRPCRGPRRGWHWRCRSPQTSPHEAG